MPPRAQTRICAAAITLTLALASTLGCAGRSLAPPSNLPEGPRLPGRLASSQSALCKVGGAAPITCWGAISRHTLDRVEDELERHHPTALRLSVRTSCALNGSGRLRCWRAEYRDHTRHKPLPEVINFDAFYDQACAVQASGDVQCVNRYRWSRIRGIKGAPEAVAVRDGHACALTDRGVYCWRRAEGGRRWWSRWTRSRPRDFRRAYRLRARGRPPAELWPMCANTSSPARACEGYRRFADALHIRGAAVAENMLDACRLDEAGAVWCWDLDRWSPGAEASQARVGALSGARELVMWQERPCVLMADDRVLCFEEEQGDFVERRPEDAVLSRRTLMLQQARQRREQVERQQRERLERASPAAAAGR